MNSARMSPGQDPDEFLYELDTRRERLNACDPPEGPADRQFEDIILQALPPEYERIRISHLEKPDFGIADIRRMMSAIYAANLARSSSTTGIVRHEAAMSAAEYKRRDITCHYCERAGHFKNRYPLRAKYEQHRQQRKQRNEQLNQQQGGRRQRGRQRRGKTSRQPPSIGGRWCSYHNTTYHSDSDCRAIKNANIKNANGNAHVAAAQHTCMQRICSAPDIPYPKKDSERPFISFSATEVTSSAAITTSKQDKCTWPFGPSPATCPWPFAERETPVIDFGRQSKHDPTYMFDTDGEGPLYDTALMSLPATVAYNNASDCSNLVHVLVDSGAPDHYFDDFLIPMFNRHLLDYTCLTTPRKILTAG